MRSASGSSLSCAALLWRDGARRPRVTVIVKVTYALVPGGVAEIADPLPIEGDVPRDRSRPSSLVSASDLVPLKMFADVTLVGRAHRHGATTARQVIGFGVARGADVLVQRRLVATGRRDRAGALAPLEPFDVCHEHALGGAGAQENPVGLADDGGAVPPRLLDPTTRGPSVAFGPISPAWASRARLLPADRRAVLDAQPLELPSDFDVRFFQSAPRDQQTSRLRGGERILLVGLRPEAFAVICRLPALHPFARVDCAGMRRRNVSLAGDTLWIDAERSLATLTFRGSLEIERRHERDATHPGAFSIDAGLAPCEDVEAVIAEPPAWSSLTARPAQKRAPSPLVDPVTLDDTSGFAVGTLAWAPDPGKTRRTVIVKGTFDIDPGGGPVTLADAQEPLHGDVLAGEKELAPLERASDFVPLKSRADVLLHGTAHAPPGASTALVTLAVGPVVARVVALPPRAWDRSGVPQPSGPFAPVPLRYENAFGGPMIAANPCGTGAAEGSPPPRLEHPDRLMRTRADRPTPAAFAPIAPSWEPRRSLLGSFDAAWQRERWPCFPVGLDVAHFQSAPEELRCPYLAGDESFRVEHVRPGGGDVSGSLAGVRPRALVARDTDESPAEVPLHLDTVVIDADAMRVTVTWRGSFDLTSGAAHVTVVRDEVRAPRPFDDLAAFVCARSVPALAIPGASPAPDASSHTLADVLRRRAGRAASSLALALGAAASAFAASTAKPAPPPLPPPPTRREIEERLAAGKDVRGLDLSGAALAGIDLSGVDLHGVIFACADLTDARLAGANLAGANLAGVVAPRSCWDGADLTQADLTGADLTAATLVRATVTQAKLAEARLEDARLDGAEGEGASFVKAALGRARAPSAKLPKVDLSYARAAEAHFHGAVLDDGKLLEIDAPGAIFDDASLADARFESASLASSSFLNTSAPGAVFEQSDLTSARLHKADLTSAVLAGATLARADLRAVRARGALFREANLEGARLDGADLMRASFEAANLRRASLLGASLFQAETWQAVTDQADMTGALLTGTKLAPRAK